MDKISLHMRMFNMTEIKNINSLTYQTKKQTRIRQTNKPNKETRTRKDTC